MMPHKISPKRNFSPGSPERFVRTYLILAVVSLLLILALAYSVLSDHNNRNLKRDAENNASMIARSISAHEFETITIIQQNGQSSLFIEAKDIQTLHNSLKIFLTPFNIRKIKIYNAGHQIIYCTDQTLIGKTDKDNATLSVALNGRTQSKIKLRTSMPDLSGENPIPVDLAEVYVPIFDSQQRVVGVFELYADITSLKLELKNHLRSSMSAIAISLLPLLLLSYLIVRKETNELRSAHKLLASIAATDALTGIANRYHLLKQAEVHFSLLRRKRNKFDKEIGMGLIMIDVDHFKQINDRYGHLVGDEALILVTRRITQAVRTYDVFGRYGGEEFLVVLPQAHETEILDIAHRINRIVADDPVELEGLSLTVTVSVGCSWTNAQDEDLDVALRRADQNLYDAKKQGRNRVSYCSIHQNQQLELSIDS